MKRMTYSGWLLSVLMLSLCAVHGAAQAGPFDSDRSGGSDHALVSRYAGSTLYQHGGENYGSAPMLIKMNKEVKEQPFEGTITNRLYWGPRGRAPLEIFRNYQSALRSAGFTTVYQCETQQCDDENAQRKMSFWGSKARWADNGASDYYVIRLFQAKPSFNYLHAQKKGVHVQLAVRAGEDDDPNSSGRTLQFLQIVEPAQVDQGNVTVDAAAIGDALKREGKIALYGIHFDTSLAVIKSESAPELAQMAAALKNTPALSVFIVGHTDNQGNFESNVTLSRRRAQAVVDALVTTHGIPRNRLLAQGVANFAPSASNDSDAGRAKNRRVEMVVR